MPDVKGKWSYVLFENRGFTDLGEGKSFVEKRFAQQGKSFFEKEKEKEKSARKNPSPMRSPIPPPEELFEHEIESYFAKDQIVESAETPNENENNPAGEVVPTVE